jgi:hypothetical protein
VIDFYPLPVFDRDAVCRTRNVVPTGKYGHDCTTGQYCAIEFLRSCDGSVGWSSLLSDIVADMIRAGPDGAFADGRPKVNGVVIGFMSTLGSALGTATKAATLEDTMPTTLPPREPSDLEQIVRHLRA